LLLESRLLPEIINLNLAYNVECITANEIFFFFVGDKFVQVASSLLRSRYKKNRCIPPDDDWPPYHPKHYTPLIIIHHEGKRTEREIINVAKRMAKEENVKYYGQTVKCIADFFVPFEKSSFSSFIILIEGAPGIGKTILSKEMALQWANRMILKNVKLMFLLFLRDPQVKNINSIPSLVNYFYESRELARKITEWLVETDGNCLTLVLDGYDEVSEVNKNPFIYNIINRQKLTECGLVITSRPNASSDLHKVVNCRAEVLGFTEEDKMVYMDKMTKSRT